LENHLYDDIQKLIDEGKNEEEAFEIAKNNLGDISLLSSQSYESKRKHSSAIKNIFWDLPILANQIKLSIRRLSRNKAFGLINLGGLTVALTVCFFISLYISDELIYDKYNINYEKIYRIENIITLETGDIRHEAQVPITWGPSLEEEYSDVKDAARLMVSRGDILIRIGDETFIEDSYCYADDALFDIFSYQFIAGDNEKPLGRPNTAVVTEDFAKKHFGDENPVGKIIETDVSWYGSIQYEITALVENLPSNSHFDKGLYLSFYTLADELFVDINQDWGIHYYYTYLLINNQNDAAELENKLSSFINRHYRKEIGEDYKPILIPLSEIYFHSDVEHPIGPVSSYNRVLFLASIALLILGIAVFNYVNLSTAQSIDKSKEIGIRKVMGASRPSIFKQILSESTVLAFCASLIAIILVILLLPNFNQIAVKDINVNIGLIVNKTGWMLLATVILGILAGLYPAILLSSFKPTSLFRSLSTSGRKAVNLRSALVGIQFAISSFLIIGTIVVNHQINFIQNRDLGFDKESIISVNMGSREIINKYDVLKNKIQSQDGVLASSATPGLPGSRFFYAGYRFDNLGSSDNVFEMARHHVDHNFFETMDITILAGEIPENNFNSDSSGMVVINRAAMNELGITDPYKVIGHRVTYERPNGDLMETTVVAVSENFNWSSLHHKIEPIVMDYWNEGFTTLNIRLDEVNQSVIANIEKAFKSTFPGNSFEFIFLDDRINALYDKEIRFGKIFSIFSLVALIISGVGLLGVSAFFMERKTREIAVRKVLGANMWQIASMFSFNMIKLAGIAFIIASPFAYYLFENWLEDFAYRINIGPSVFLFTSLVLLLTILLSVGWQALKAGMMNPVKNLRSE
ncbi:MAG: FtsX-like permease family protein, partial [Cyclobacteriaceae bacterium]|nr:FtsX-like permease family protein [Cyclobacteriaceae bacterium]